METSPPALPPHLQNFLIKSAEHYATVPVEFPNVLYLDEETILRQLQKIRLLTPTLPEIYYAVKTNPDPSLLRTLASRECGMDVASPYELNLAVQAGVPPEKISYGNTVKHPQDIAYAHTRGVKLYTADSMNEIRKIGMHAPGSQVWIRLAVSSEGSLFHLSAKFGASPDMFAELVREARNVGVNVAGVHFHVGSQQTTPHAYHTALETVHYLTSEEHHPDIHRYFQQTGLRINFGGGFPSYGHAPGTATPLPWDAYRETFAWWDSRFGESLGVPPLWAGEPGRFIAAEAGIYATRVLDVNVRPGFPKYLILMGGRYSGMQETNLLPPDIRTTYDVKGETPPDTDLFTVAGPTCDSDDTILNGTTFELPSSLQTDDPIFFMSQGAYSQTVASNSFNGFPNAEVVWLEP